MALSVEIRAARLVAQLTRQGVAVRYMTICGEEIQVFFVDDKVSAYKGTSADPDLIDWGRSTPSKVRKNRTTAQRE